VKQKITADLELFKMMNPDLCNEKWGIDHYLARFPVPLLDGITRLGMFIFREFFKLFKPQQQVERGRHIVVVGSSNNQRVVDLSFSHVEEKVIVGFHSWNAGSNISLLMTYLRGLPSLLLLPWYIAQAPTANFRRGIMLRLDQFILCCGGTKYVEKQLQKMAPLSLTHMNNTSVYCSIFTAAAKNLGVPTVFVPHAAIGRDQAPLLVDYALLEGMVQAKQFPKSETEVLLTGAPRLQAIRASAKRNVRDGLLFCTNYAMAEETISGACRQLRKQFASGAIGLRPHPAERRIAFHENLCTTYQFEYVDPTVPLGEFSDNFSKILTTESGVVLDAAMCGLAPYIFESITMDDFFCFVELGLAEEVTLNDLELSGNFAQKEDYKAKLTAFDSSIISDQDPAIAVANFYQKLVRSLRAADETGQR